MQRVTSKHAPRRDDQLAHEEQALLHGTPDEGRTEPRRTEAPGDDEPSIGHRPEPGVEGADATTAPESEQKAALAACFTPSSFPARRDQLVAQAAARFAEDSTVAALRHLPDAVYGSVDDVWDALQAEGGSHPGGELFGEPADWSGETEPDDGGPAPGDGGPVPGERGRPG
jgi:hypothetical protein